MSNHSSTSPSSTLRTLDRRFRLRRVVSHEVGIGATVYLGDDLYTRRRVLVVLADNERAAPSDDPLRAWIPILRHPGLVDVIETHAPGERPYLVLGMPEGTPMGRIVARYGRYDATRFANIGAQLLSTVGYLHEQGLVHGDLHIDNIHVSGRDPRTARVTVAGAYGCSRVPRPGPVTDTEQTRLAPMPDARPLDPRDDVLALGVLLESVLELSPSPDDDDDRLRVQLKALCERCTSPARARRPANAGTVLEAFSACFDRASTGAEPSSLPDTPTRLLPLGESVELWGPPTASMTIPMRRPPVPIPAVDPSSLPAALPAAEPSPGPAASVDMMAGSGPYAIVPPGQGLAMGIPSTTPTQRPTVPPVGMMSPMQPPPMSAVGPDSSYPHPARVHVRRDRSRLGRMFGLTAATLVSTGVLLAWPRPTPNEEVTVASAPVDSPAVDELVVASPAVDTAPVNAAPVDASVVDSPAPHVPSTSPPPVALDAAVPVPPATARPPETTCPETPSGALAMKEDTPQPMSPMALVSELNLGPSDARAEALWSEPAPRPTGETEADPDEPAPARTHKRKARKAPPRRRTSTAEPTPRDLPFMGVSR